MHKAVFHLHMYFCIDALIQAFITFFNSFNHHSIHPSIHPSIHACLCAFIHLFTYLFAFVHSFNEHNTLKFIEASGEMWSGLTMAQGGLWASFSSLGVGTPEGG